MLSVLELRTGTGMYVRGSWHQVSNGTSVHEVWFHVKTDPYISSTVCLVWSCDS